MPDSQVIKDIVDCADRWHANAVVLLATALHENGAVYDCSGDPDSGGTTSYGPFQFNTRGALIGHPPSWACTKDAMCNRARAFAMAGVRDGAGARKVQGADPAGGKYAAAVNQLMPAADRYIRAYRNGTLPEGEHIDTAGNNPLPGVSAVSGAVSTVTDGIGSVGDAIRWATNTDNAIRVGMVLGGIILVSLGVIVVIKQEVPMPPVIPV